MTKYEIKHEICTFIVDLLVKAFRYDGYNSFTRWYAKINDNVYDLGSIDVWACWDQERELCRIDREEDDPWWESKDFQETRKNWIDWLEDEGFELGEPLDWEPSNIDLEFHTDDYQPQNEEEEKE